MKTALTIGIALFACALWKGSVLQSAPLPYNLANPTPAHDEPFILRAYRIPPNFFSEADPASKEGKRRLYDAKKTLENLGVTFPPGAQASYDIASQCLVVRQTAANIEQLDGLLLSTCCGQALQLQCEISAYRISPALATMLPKSGNLPPEILKKLANSGKLLARLQGTVESGQNAEVSKQSGGTTSRLRVQPVIGPDGTTIDIQLDYLLKTLPSGKENPTELELKSTTRVEDGHSVIVETAAIPSDIAVFLRARIVTPSGWALDEAHDGKILNR